MKGTEIFALGKESAAAEAAIPLAFVHTAPRMRFKGAWQAEFWYFIKDPADDSICAPQFYLVLAVPSGHLVEFQTLDGGQRIGFAPELASQEFYDALQLYLQRCDALVPEEKFLQALAAQWLSTLPKALRVRFEQAPPPEFSPAKSPASLAEMLAAAIRAGDAAAIRKLQTEMQKGSVKS